MGFVATPVEPIIASTSAANKVFVRVLGVEGVLSDPTTSKVIVHRLGVAFDPARIVPPVRVTTAEPGAAVRVPPQVVMAFGTAATRTPLVAVPGIVSVTETFVIGTLDVLNSVSVTVERPPA